MYPALVVIPNGKNSGSNVIQDVFSPLPSTCCTAPGIVLFIGMGRWCLAQVVARKFFEPLVWSEELARYTFIWVAFIGWVIATQSNRTSTFRWSPTAPAVAGLALGVFSDLA